MSTSDCPAPTVSTMIGSKPAASSRSTTRRVGARQAAGMAARRERADEHRSAAPLLAHPDAIAEHRAAGDRARRIDRDHRDAPAARRVLAQQRVDQRRLAGARRAGDADHVRAADIAQRAPRTARRAAGSVVLDLRDARARSAARAGADRGDALLDGGRRRRRRTRVRRGLLHRRADQTTTSGWPKPSSRRSVPQISPCVQPAPAAATTRAEDVAAVAPARAARGRRAPARPPPADRAAFHAANAAMCARIFAGSGCAQRRARARRPRRPGRR